MSKTCIHWSSGKDAAFAYYTYAQKFPKEVTLGIVNLSAKFKRITMHGLSESVLDRQMEMLPFSVRKVFLPENTTNEVYEEIMRALYFDLAKEGYTKTIFGDIFLDDLKAYRNTLLDGSSLEPKYPLWKRNTRTLAESFFQEGFKAIVVAVNASLLDQSYVGVPYDTAFLDRLPKGVDPCGENGEFHTFCYAGPIFKQAVSYTLGEKQYKSYPNPSGGTPFGVWFCAVY